MKTKYYEYNKQVSGEKYSEFTESEYLKASKDKNRWFISFGDSVLECEESEYSDYFSEKNHSDYTQRDKYGKKIIPILLEQYTYSDSACTTKNGEPASKLHSVELVTPILEYGDMALLQEVVRSIRRSGGICNESTGIHIHIDFEPYDARTLRNLVNIFASKEDMLYEALQVNSNRENTYCKKVDKRFLEKLNEIKPKDLQTIKRLWYGDNAEYHSHYDPSRYRCFYAQ